MYNESSLTFGKLTNWISVVTIIDTRWKKTEKLKRIAIAEQSIEKRLFYNVCVSSRSTHTLILHYMHVSHYAKARIPNLSLFIPLSPHLLWLCFLTHPHSVAWLAGNRFSSSAAVLRRVKRCFFRLSPFSHIFLFPRFFVFFLYSVFWWCVHFSIFVCCVVTRKYSSSLFLIFSYSFGNCSSRY